MIMAKYILSYDRLQEKDPFEQIVRILSEANIDLKLLERPVQSTITFINCQALESDCLKLIEMKLRECCYYLLAKVDGLCSMNPNEDLMSNTPKELQSIIENKYKANSNK